MELPLSGVHIVSHSLSQGGCDVGLRLPDKVLGNPGREAWEEAGVRRLERTCSWIAQGQPRRLCLAWLRKVDVRGLGPELPDLAGLGRGWFYCEGREGPKLVPCQGAA